MGYQPIYDCEYDLAIGAGEANVVLTEAMKHKMMVCGWVDSGPAGGNPMITLRGTRRQHMAWLRSFYDPDEEIIGSNNGESFDDDAAWHEYKEALNFTFVA